MGESKTLTRAQKRWCELVSLGMNGAVAARQLWPKLKSPKDKAYNLRHLPHVQAYMARLDANAMASAEVSRTEIVMRLARIARFDPRLLVNEDGSPKKVNQLDDDTAGAIAGVQFDGSAVEFKACNRNHALAELAHIAGLKRQEIDLSVGTVVKVVDLTGAKKPEAQDE